jgi:hypothetical protein
MSYLDTDRARIDALIAAHGAERFCTDLAILRRWYFAWCLNALADSTARERVSLNLLALADRFSELGLTGVAAAAESLRGTLRYRPLNSYEITMLDDAATRAITLVTLKHQYHAVAPPAAQRSRARLLRRPWGRTGAVAAGSIAAQTS